MQEEEIIRGCLKHDRNFQRALFEMYSAAMLDVCTRYSKSSDAAKEVLLIGFKNIFSNIRQFTEENARLKSEQSPVKFEEWMKKEMILAAVAYMHSKKKEHFISSTVSMRDGEKYSEGDLPDEKIMQHASKASIIKALQQLSPSFRTVYNMHDVDGYSHEAISKLLDISEYSSKDSLTKAKFNLRRNLARMVPKG